MKAAALFLAACLLAAIAPLLSSRFAAAPSKSNFPGWFSHFDGALLRRLEPSEQERRFAEGFPGQVAQFTDGRRILMFRYTEQTTRKLHPAAHCFRGSGYKLDPLRQRIDMEGNRWGCMLATREDEKLRVCERIFDTRGASWTDVSSWYWAAVFGTTRSPWWAVTTVETAAHDIL
jgi:hypothetical protein